MLVLDVSRVPVVRSRVVLTRAAMRGRLHEASPCDSRELFNEAKLRPVAYKDESLSL
jgi:hypothetical protein